MALGRFFLDALAATAQAGVAARAQHPASGPGQAGRRPHGVPCTPCAAAQLRRDANAAFMPTRKVRR